MIVYTSSLKGFIYLCKACSVLKIKPPTPYKGGGESSACPSGGERETYFPKP